MFKRMKLSTKLIVSFLLVGILPACIIGILAINRASNALERESLSKLIAIRDAKKVEVQDYYNEAIVGMETFARSKDAKELYAKLIEYHEKMHTKPDGDYNVDTPEYKAIWDEYGKNLEEYREDTGFYDIFMICAKHGHIMYTAARESDLGKNLRHGSLRGSGLAKVFEKIVSRNSAAVADFQPYAPSNNEPASFAGCPIHDDDGNIIGAMIVQLSIDRINHIMQQRAGMGKTGETYLVGSDKLMRSDLFLDKTNHSIKASFAGNVANNGVDTVASNEALSGKTDAKIITNYNGHKVLSAYTPIKIGDVTWALIAELDEDEALAAVHLFKRIMVILLIISVCITVFVGFSISIGIAKPISQIIQGLQEGSEQVASAASQVSSTAQTLAEGASEQAANMEETSSSLEEISSMIKQNSDNAQQANALASDAKRASDEGSSSMARMEEAIVNIQKSSDETAKIIKVIDEIAFQTNLLALNAAVEAARAGEAGKGFAVVAEEVRNLAMRSAEAAKDTSSMIEESVKNSRGGVEIAKEVSKSLKEITEKSAQVNNLISEIAAASEEQTQGVVQINSAITQVDKVTQATASNSEESAAAAEELSSQADQMKEIVRSLSELVGGNSVSAAQSNVGSSHTNLTQSDRAFHQVVDSSELSESSIPFNDNVDAFNI